MPPRRWRALHRARTPLPASSPARRGGDGGLAPALAGPLQGHCPDCGAAVDGPFDPRRYCLRELRDRARFVYDDVDRWPSATTGPSGRSCACRTRGERSMPSGAGGRTA